MNCIIIHGSSRRDKRKDKDYLPQDKRHWMPWIKEELEKRGVNTSVPVMLTNWNPKYGEWKEEFEKLDVNENTILIGHSAGAAFLVRWLGETGEKIKKLILVAPAKIVTEDNIRLKEFCSFDIKRNIKNDVGEIIIFVSDDESVGIKRSAKIYQKELEAKLIELRGKGHFVMKHMKTEKFPELLEEVLSK